MRTGRAGTVAARYDKDRRRDSRVSGLVQWPLCKALHNGHNRTVGTELQFSLKRAEELRAGDKQVDGQDEGSRPQRTYHLHHHTQECTARAARARLTNCELATDRSKYRSAQTRYRACA